MQCNYKYGQSHRDVVAGRVALGSRCKANAYDERGFCYNHLRDEGLLTVEELNKVIEDKQKASTARRTAAISQKKDTLCSDGDLNYIARAIKDFLVIPDFDLLDFFTLIGGIGVGATDSNYRRKYALAFWMLSDPDTRQPQALEEVAKTLQCSTVFVKECMRGNRMDRFIRKAREKVMLDRLEPAYLAWMGVGVETGDKEAIKAYKEMRDRVAAESSVVEQEIPDDVLEEANRINSEIHARAHSVADCVGWGEENAT